MEEEIIDVEIDWSGPNVIELDEIFPRPETFSTTIVRAESIPAGFTLDTDTRTISGTPDEKYNESTVVARVAHQFKDAFVGVDMSNERWFEDALSTPNRVNIENNLVIISYDEEGNEYNFSTQSGVGHVIAPEGYLQVHVATPVTFMGDQFIEEELFPVMAEIVMVIDRPAGPIVEPESQADIIYSSRSRLRVNLGPSGLRIFSLPSQTLIHTVEDVDIADGNAHVWALLMDSAGETSVYLNGAFRTTVASTADDKSLGFDIYSAVRPIPDCVTRCLSLAIYTGNGSSDNIDSIIERHVTSPTFRTYGAIRFIGDEPETIEEEDDDEEEEEQEEEQEESTVTAPSLKSDSNSTNTNKKEQDEISNMELYTSTAAAGVGVCVALFMSMFA